MKRIIFGTFLLLTSTFLYADLEIDDFYICIDNSKIALGDEFSKAIDILGITDYDIQDYGSITLRMYRYDTVIISASNTESEEGKNRIYGISLLSDRYSIIDGLTIGSPRDDVFQLLGQPDTVFKGALYYFNEDFDVLELKLTFDSEDKIDAIRIFMGT